jgi:hypothetical protein
LTYFLVEYDRKLQKAVVTEFADAARAIPELNARELARRTDVEVVLLIADSREQLIRTHSRYFLSTQELRNRLLTRSAALA